MSSGEGKENGEKTTFVLKQKSNFVCTPQFFFGRFSAAVLHDYKVKLLETS